MSETDIDLSELPDGWVWTTLGEIIEPSKEKVNPLVIEEVPYISLEHIEKDTGKLLGHGRSSDVRSSKTKFNGGDLLYGKLRPYLNKVYISDFEGVCSTDLLVFPNNELLSNAFFLYRFLCRDFVNYASHNVSGVNLPRVNFQTLSRFKIPLPPLSEQHRIVAKIEELFTKLDAGINELHKAQSQLKRYRQSVLKAAFEGKLTEAWRAEHQEKIESTALITGDLPNGWVWTTVKSSIKKVSLGGKKLQQKNYEEVGKLPVIDQGLSFIGGYTNREELKVECQLPIIVFGDHTKAFKYVDFDFVAGADGIKVMQPQEMYDPKLFYYFVQATSLPEKGYARHFQFLEKALIPLPPLLEQQAIVSEVESRLSVADEVEKTVAVELKRAEQLRQSILKKAFSGKLVPQDPNDESASVLLERIKAEKSQHTQGQLMLNV